MVLFLVILGRGEKLMVQEKWVLSPQLFSMSKIFVAPNEKMEADFSLPLSKDFNRDQVACYQGFVCQQFGKLISMNYYY